MKKQRVEDFGALPAHAWNDGKGGPVSLDYTPNCMAQ